ncbi:MAG: LPS-assembly protein LptD [Treponema sp.]|jgi:hypothetical protein|nr:LPS-assembly protein LptD [Treponema sp.]
MKTSRGPALFFLLVFLSVSLHSQNRDAAEKSAGGLSAEFVLERDIATSSLQDLARWCRSLGLSEGGDKDALAARLREYYKAAPPVPAESPETEAGGKRKLVITINSAKATEYFTVDSVKEEYVRLRDGVSVSLQDGEIVHRIEAGEILYNRTRELMTASGGIVYIKEEGDKVETFRGDGITVNLNNWSTAFMRGISDHEMSGGGARYRFSGEVISRSGEDSTVLRRAEISNPDDEEALWSINASKLWLLPGSDWAVLNAVIKVGEIPVLYLPAFYYPANEIIFHPVFGIRAREGTFLQTTTYILGRPKASGSSEESSITAIMGSGEGMEKKREGVFLRSTGRKAVDEKAVRLSFMADAYTNLGYFVGSELTIPSRGRFGELVFSGGAAFSRDIAGPLDGAYFTPFYPDFDGTSNWHDSTFFGLELPFRYRFTGAGSMNASGKTVRSAGLSWGFPVYSDPYVDNDFMRRSEDSNLFSLLKDSMNTEMTIHNSPLSSNVWRVNGSLYLNTAGLDPYINELSLTSAAASLNFGVRSPDGAINPADVPDSSLSLPPNTRFFYPDKLTPFSLSASIGGRPVALGEGNRGTETGEEAVIPGLGKPISPWQADPVEAAPGGPDDPLGLRPPPLTRTLTSPLLGAHRFSLDYRVSPSASSEIKFNSSKVDTALAAGSPGYNIKWNNSSDIDWSDIAHRLYTFRVDGSVGLNFSESRNMYSTSLRFYGTASWQDYAYLNETASEYDTVSKRESVHRQARNMSYFSSSAEYDFTLNPFYQNEIWRETNFRYSLKGLLAKGLYNATDQWEILWGKWNQDTIDFHRTQANFNANIMDKVQTFSLTADMPPEETALAGDATIRAWISETNARGRIREPLEDPFYEPFYFTEVLRFTPSAYLRHYMVYDPGPQVSDFTILTTSLVLWGFNASFTAGRSRGYELEDDEFNALGRPLGWYLKTGTEQFNPQSLVLSYRGTLPINPGGKVSLESTINSGITLDLQRYTYSKFTFTLGLKASISRFLDITLNSHSENAEIFRYFQGLPVYDIGIDLPGEKNPLKDLINSFRFDDIEKRRSSGFKLKSFSLDMVHHLGDWDASLGIKMTPELTDVTIGGTVRKQYRFYTEVSFLVQWKPIQEFRAKIVQNKDGLNYE